MNFTKKFLIPLSLTCIISFCSCNIYSSSYLNKYNWSENNYDSLNQLIDKYKNPNSNTQEKNYAVFDFDNTSIFGDVSASKQIYQLDNLIFKIPPEHFYTLLISGIPDAPFNPKWNNSLNHEVYPSAVIHDCTMDYDYLYQNYINSGSQDLASIKDTPYFTDFKTKVIYLYEAIDDTFGHDVSYPWLSWVDFGMTPQEVQELTVKSTDYFLKSSEYKNITLSSPSDLPGASGILSVSYFTGLAILPEMTNLYNSLTKNGIDVYICSASFYDVILAVASNPKYGFNLPSDHVYAMKLMLDHDSKFTNVLDEDSYITQGIGKSLTIENFIKPIYNYKDPILVAGDSIGDYNMLTDFENMKVGLIINHLKTDNFQSLYDYARNPQPDSNKVYLLQGCDKNKGTFINSQESIPIK